MQLSEFMDTSATQKEIQSLERKYWQAMQDNDVETAISLTHFPCVVTGPHGARHVSESEYRRMMKSHPPDYHSDLLLEDMKVEVVSDDTAIISYSLYADGAKHIDASTWVKTNGHWKCAFHTETLSAATSPINA